MDEETKKKIDGVEDNLDKVMLESRDLDHRVTKLEKRKGRKKNG